MRLTLSLALAAILASAPLAAEDAAIWSQSELKGYTAKLKPQLNADHYALENLGDFGSHYVLTVYREGNGPAELHEGATDFYVVQAGSGTLHVGGSIVEGKETEPGEVRGKSLKGAETTKLKPGDTVNIPPKTPHQITLADGETITYLIVKVYAR